MHPPRILSLKLETLLGNLKPGSNRITPIANTSHPRVDQTDLKLKGTQLSSRKLLKPRVAGYKPWPGGLHEASKMFPVNQQHQHLDPGVAPLPHQVIKLLRPGGPFRKSENPRSGVCFREVCFSKHLFLTNPSMVQNRYHFGIGAPILEPILVGIGMFTGGTIWVLTHGQLF